MIRAAMSDVCMQKRRGEIANERYLRLPLLFRKNAVSVKKEEEIELECDIPHSFF